MLACIWSFDREGLNSLLEDVFADAMDLGESTTLTTASCTKAGPFLLPAERRFDGMGSIPERAWFSEAIVGVVSPLSSTFCGSGVCSLEAFWSMSSAKPSRNFCDFISRLISKNNHCPRPDD